MKTAKTVDDDEIVPVSAYTVLPAFPTDHKYKKWIALWVLFSIMATEFYTIDNP